MASQYGRRPSEFVHVEDEWAAFQFDSAVYRFGRWAENRLAKKLPVFDVPARPMTKKRAAEEYPNPLGVLSKLGKVKRGKVPESGVW